MDKGINVQSSHYYASWLRCSTPSQYSILICCHCRLTIYMFPVIVKYYWLLISMCTTCLWHHFASLVVISLLILHKSVDQFHFILPSTASSFFYSRCKAPEFLEFFSSQRTGTHPTNSSTMDYSWISHTHGFQCTTAILILSICLSICRTGNPHLSGLICWNRMDWTPNNSDVSSFCGEIPQSNFRGTSQKMELNTDSPCQKWQFEKYAR